MEKYSKREFDDINDTQLFPIIDEENNILYYYNVEFDTKGKQTNLYKVYQKELKETNKELLISKKLIVLNNVLFDNGNYVKVVDKNYTANIEQDEYDVID
jgi:hypothetical protein